MFIKNMTINNKCCCEYKMMKTLESIQGATWGKNFVLVVNRLMNIINKILYEFYIMLIYTF